MHRRRFVATGALVALGGVAGCLENGEYPTQQFEGESVPLVPTDDAYEWFDAGDARFVDARSRAEYDEIRVEGAAHSPAPTGLAKGDPVVEWSTDERIVTYCVCPHALAGSRAGTLVGEGYEAVYALDEGLNSWLENEYPVAGDGIGGRLPEYAIEGETDAAHAGEDVWLREPETDQREVTTVADDGSYELTFHFVDLAGDTLLELEAPDYALESTLADLTAGVVTG